MKGERSCIIISISSDIGLALCNHWNEQGIKVLGTYRTYNEKLDQIKRNNKAKLFECDLLNDFSIDKACKEIVSYSPIWDILVFASGILEPVGLFENINYKNWQDNIKVNFLSCMNILHQLLPYRNKNSDKKPVILFFAGGGTNNAPRESSSYVISKIALVKSTEILAKEIPDSNFTIIGPGWVKTKIHESILNKKEGEIYQKTVKRFQDNDFISMNKVLACLDWIITTESSSISGRNISISSDKIGSKELEIALDQDDDMYKLRRHKNFWDV